MGTDMRATDRTARAWASFRGITRPAWLGGATRRPWPADCGQVAGPP